MVPDPVPWFIQLGLRVEPASVPRFIVRRFIPDAPLEKNRTCVIMD